MQVKIFSIPLVGGEGLNEELNTFLRSKKVLQVDKELVNTGVQAFWSFCVTYFEDNQDTQSKVRIDYKEILDQASFERFSLFDLQE